MGEHVMYARETTWGTYVAPTKAIPATTFNVTPGIDFMEVADTGPGGRGRLAGAPGALSVAGGLQTQLYPQRVGDFIRSVMTTRVATPSSETTGVAVTASTAASPTVLTVASSAAMKVGDAILLSGHSGGTPSLNGVQIITAVISATEISIGVTVTVAGTWTAGNAKLTTIRNKLLFNDAIAQDSFSFQKYYDAARAEYIRGAKLTRFGVGVRSREFAKFTADFVGKDATKNAGTWADGTASPAITPYTHAPSAYFYPPAIYDALKFYQASIRLGGSVALTAGELVVTGGTARTEIDNLSFDVNLGLGADAYGIVMDDRTVQAIDDGPRTISLSFEPNFKSVWFEFYDLWKANPQLPLIVEAYFRGRVAYSVPSSTTVEYKFTFPNVRISGAPTPDQNAAYGLKRQTVTAQGAVDGVTGHDMGCVIQGPEDLSI